MKKKIIAVILSVVLCLSMTIPAYAAFDIGSIIGGLTGGSDNSESSDISDILQSIMDSDIFKDIMATDGVVDITNIVMEIATEIMSGDIQAGAQEEATAVMQSTINYIAKFITTFYENKGLIVKYDPQKVIHNLFGIDIGGGKEDVTGEDDNKDNDDTLVIGPGDVDGDGKITAADARLILRRSAKLVVFTDAQDKLADVNKDGKITATDARMVLRASANLEKLPA